MSYLVLARKWRPKRFAELVGQEHVVRALTNALGTGRVHHAFLFSGTRGVGKTTIARIFAKSLNCERGSSADPCGECETCLAIDAGRYIDLLEIDAASNTGVDNVRELIDNAQYMPSRGRVKVYLIDEVHMLSKQAFNALLKTLEEPPGHVKFLLATTDPEKLPVTVLSRCLQFNLKRLDEDQIGGQIAMILQAEGIAVEPGAIRQLSKAADGSLRDGLSLLDQVIAYTGAGPHAPLSDDAVATMLGTVDRTRVGALLSALADGQGEALLGEIAALAEFSPDWGGVLEALTEALHRVQVRQLVPEMQMEADGVDVDALAAGLRPEVVQLWYQMALNGRRDLPLAPSPRAGFEMSLLRMLAFRPAGDEGSRAVPVAGAAARAAPPSREAAGLAPAPRSASPVMTAAAAATREAAAPSPAARESSRIAEPALALHGFTGLSASPVQVSAPVSAPIAAPARPVDIAGAPAAIAPGHRVATVAVAAFNGAGSAGTTSGGTIVDADEWHRLIASSGLRGPARLLAEHAGFVGYADGVLRLSLPATEEHLGGPATVKMVAEALAPALGTVPQIRFEAADKPAQSLRERNERARDQRQAAAEETFMNDPDVQRLISQHGARIVPDSIRPFDE